MRVGLDGTPLLGQRTGVGQYVAGLLDGFAEIDGAPEVVTTLFTWRRGTGALGGAGHRVSARRAPARLLLAAWSRWEWPPVELLCGRVDVFHATNFVLPPMRRARGVVTVHDLGFLEHAATVTAASRRYRDLVPHSLDRAAIVCAVSAAMADEIATTYAIDRDRIVVTPLGVRSSWFGAQPADAAWLARRGLPHDYVLFVGTREPRKNLDRLLAAYAALRADRADLPRLVLVGPSGWGPALQRAELSADAVRTVDYLDLPELQRVVARARLLVYPSLHEGFGLPPLEALACGTPVVASDLPVLREVLGDAARFAPPDDVAAIGASIASALAEHDDETIRERRRARARQFTWRRCAEATVAAYERALS